MAQLVGQNCVQCGERIPDELDARFCPACRAPVHLRCMSPSASLGCPTCGAPVAPILLAPPATGAAPPTPTRPPWPARLRVFLAVFYGLAVAWGCRSVDDRPAVLDGIMPLALAVTLGGWAIADARGRRRPLPLLTRPWFFLAAWMLVPGYVVWTRGWRGAVWVMAHFLLWFGVAIGTMLLTSIIVYGDIRAPE